MDFPTHKGGSTPSDDLLRLALEAAPAAIVIVDSAGKLIFLNAEAEKLFGYHPQELLGQPLEMLLPQPWRKDYATVRNDFLTSTEGPVMAARRALCGQRKDGSRFPVELRSNPIHSERGESVLSVIVGEERFRLAVEAAPNAMVMADQEGKIVLVNSQVERLFGYSQKELLGQTIETLVPESLRKGHVGLRDEFFTQPLARPMGVGLDLHAQRKDGTQFPVEIGLNPIETAEGTLVLSAIIDITERKGAELALRESEELFRSIADTAPVMIWVSGPDKLCTFFNLGWLTFTGRGMAQELGNGWTEGVHPDDLERCVDTRNISFDRRHDFEMEYRLRRADGEYRWVLYRGVARFATDGNFFGYIGSCIDITDFKLREQELLPRLKIESLATFRGGITHDINSLLSGIIANADWALSDPKCFRTAVNTIKKEARRGSDIVHDLMLYAGKDQAETELVQISLEIEAMENLLRAAIPKHAKLNTSLQQNLPPILANSSHIRQLLLNLIVNAYESIDESGGVINVATSEWNTDDPVSAQAGITHRLEGHYVHLEVSDTGCGMTNEIQAKIFDPFFTTKEPGRGLGLAVTQAIVRKYGGVVDVKSAPGQGTTIDMFFPTGVQISYTE
jgi:two-component system, cell cycle sensor histidine kinase and response regulator CckA